MVTRNFLFRVIASTLQAIANCEASGNAEWLEKHRERLQRLCRDSLPSGSGIDNGTRLSDKSTPERLVFETSFHHMNEGGMYDGWTSHNVIVRASLTSMFDLRVTGRDRNQVKDYLADTFRQSLLAEVES